MKILYFIDSLRGGGKERQLGELLKGVSSHCDVLCELAVMSEELHYLALGTLPVKIHRLIRNARKDPKILLSLFKLCKKFRPDIIHTWDSMTSVYAVPVAKLLNIKFLNGMIRRTLPKPTLLEKDCLRSKLTFPFSDLVLGNSYAGLRSFRAPPRKSICIHNGFDLERAKDLPDQESVRRKFDISTEQVVGMVATFSNYKDYDTYISAAEMILEKTNQVTFLTIGSGPNFEKCRNLVRPQFGGNIKFLGEQKDVESIVNIFDIGVLATDTRYHGEGISNSIMEYMVLGKPVIATDSGGTCELVVDGKTGFLVKPHNVKDMTMKIKQLLEDSELRNRMGKAGKERIEKYFTLEKMTNAYIELYERLIMRKP